MRRLLLLLCPVLLACSGDESAEPSSGVVGAAGATSDMAYTGPVAAPSPVAPHAEAIARRGIAAVQAVQDKRASGAVQLPDATSAGSGMLIRTGSASVEVRDLARAIAAVRQLASSLGGQVANTTVQTGRDQVPSATLELKVPAGRFDAAVNGLQPLGRVESVSVEAEDVGEEFVDVTARVANAKRLEERLVSLLATRTGRLEDVLAVERELARVREEIERYEGRLRYLRTRVDVSTLTVAVHEPQPVLGRTDSPIGEAFRAAWRNFVGFVAGAIAAMGVLVPVAVLVGLAYLGLRRMRGRRPGPADV